MPGVPIQIKTSLSLETYWIYNLVINIQHEKKNKINAHANSFKPCYLSVDFRADAMHFLYAAQTFKMQVRHIDNNKIHMQLRKKIELQLYPIGWEGKINIEPRFSPISCKYGLGHLDRCIIWYSGSLPGAGEEDGEKTYRLFRRPTHCYRPTSLPWWKGSPKQWA